MKQVFIILLSLGIISTASAQWRGHEDHERGRISLGISIGTTPYRSYSDRYYADSYQSRANEINREFNHRIWEVENDYEISRWDKRRIIHGLNEERELRLDNLRRWRQGDYNRNF